MQEQKTFSAVWEALDELDRLLQARASTGSKKQPGARVQTSIYYPASVVIGTARRIIEKKAKPPELTRYKTCRQKLRMELQNPSIPSDVTKAGMRVLDLLESEKLLT